MNNTNATAAPIPVVSLADELKGKKLFEIAQTVIRDHRETGQKVNFALKPWLDALGSISEITDSYGAESGRTVIAYFLSNASQYKGATAKAVKAELKRRNK
jgi:hypothetical protein